MIASQDRDHCAVWIHFCLSFVFFIKWLLISLSVAQQCVANYPIQHSFLINKTDTYFRFSNLFLLSSTHTNQTFWYLTHMYIIKINQQASALIYTCTYNFNLHCHGEIYNCPHMLSNKMYKSKLIKCMSSFSHHIECEGLKERSDMTLKDTLHITTKYEHLQTKLSLENKTLHNQPVGH